MARRSLVSVALLLLLVHCSTHKSDPFDAEDAQASLLGCPARTDDGPCIHDCLDDAFDRNAFPQCVGGKWICAAGLRLPESCGSGCVADLDCCNSCGIVVDSVCDGPAACPTGSVPCYDLEPDAACDADASSDASDADPSDAATD